MRARSGSPFFELAELYAKAAPKAFNAMSSVIWGFALGRAGQGFAIAGQRACVPPSQQAASKAILTLQLEQALR